MEYGDFRAAAPVTVYDAQVFATRLLRPTAFALVSAIDFTLFKHVSFTTSTQQ
jgi:hypothetical protein